MEQQPHSSRSTVSLFFFFMQYKSRLLVKRVTVSHPQNKKKGKMEATAPELEKKNSKVKKTQHFLNFLNKHNLAYYSCVKFRRRMTLEVSSTKGYHKSKKYEQ